MQVAIMSWWDYRHTWAWIPQWDCTLRWTCQNGEKCFDPGGESTIGTTSNSWYSLGMRSLANAENASNLRDLISGMSKYKKVISLKNILRHMEFNKIWQQTCIKLLFMSPPECWAFANCVLSEVLIVQSEFNRVCIQIVSFEVCRQHCQVGSWCRIWGH